MGKHLSKEKSSISCLDDDSLFAVLSWLSVYQLIRLERVNRQFTRITKRIFAQQESLEFSIRPLRLCPIRSCHFGWRPMSEDYFVSMNDWQNSLENFKRFPNLRSLSLDERIELDYMRKLYTLCPQIECLSIGRYFFIKFSAKDWGEICTIIGPNLVHLIVDGRFCDFLTSAHLEKLMKAAPNLERLSLHSLSDVASQFLFAFGKRIKSLRIP